MSSLIFVDKYVENTDAIWYSAEEYEGMRKANKQAVSDAHKMYLELRSAGEEDGANGADRDFRGAVVDITGIEHLLAPLCKKTQRRRDRHWCAVLDEQDRQEQSGERDPLKLARASREHSVKSEKLALKIGIIQSRR